MTDLEKSPVTRRSTVKHKGRRIIVELRGDDTISFRGERLRFAVHANIVDLMRYAERSYIDARIPHRKQRNLE